jgi:hypothetical protein
MNTNSKSRRAERRKGCRRNRKVYGGGLGNSYTFGASVDPTNPSLGNAAVVKVFPSCQDAVRPGYLTGAPIQGGLPGFNGGGKRRTRRMNGGTYTFVPNVVGTSHISVPERSYSGCGEGQFAVQNSLNQGTFPSSVLTAPSPLVPAPSPNSSFELQKGGRRRNRKTRKYGGGTGSDAYAADAMAYQAPRSGWSEGPSSGATTAGPPFMIHTPYVNQPMPSPACLKTGGGLKKRKSRKASRKNRKASRKNRKASRKSRKNRKAY